MISIYESLCGECDVGGGYVVVVSTAGKGWMFWLPAMSVDNPSSKRQLPFESRW